MMEVSTPSTTPWKDTDRTITIKSTPETSSLNNQTQKSIKELFYNGTGYYIEDEVEPGLNDLQTLFLACFATLIPLVVSLLTAYGIRLLWIKYKREKEESKYDGMLNSAETEDSLAQPLHSHLLNTDKKGTADTHLAIGDDVEVSDCTTGVTQLRTTTNSNHSTTNGSIITMTLKNNHLIVETEERNDIEEDSRETTMKYSPGARDGVFVVEVQQGVRRSPGSGGPNSCVDPELSASISDQCALVHNPPDRYSDDETLEECDDNDYYTETTSPTTRETPDSLITQARTGLTQSDTSLTSESGRQTYCYTNQQCYDNGQYGYPVYVGYVSENHETIQRIRPSYGREDDDANGDENNSKPKITAAVYKCQNKWYGEDEQAQEEQRRLGNYVGASNGEIVESNHDDSESLGGRSRNESLHTNDSVIKEG